ncbi:MAG: type II toxin-antitoxin system HigB family toxin [Caldilineaceae bacterium]|nr:type II toxin-antitoxin system HigB family toxin [Caldilineaceae bacterium]MCB9137187.1 type II toxin-antitoxin system HigB family toxin [Caldilineaceae bacterium]
MRVIAKKTLREFWERHTDVKPQLQAWLEDTERAKWQTPRDIQDIYGADTVLPGNRAVFNIKGNNYRLVVEIHYNTGIAYIRFIGTHAEYDRIDALTI